MQTKLNVTRNILEFAPALEASVTCNRSELLVSTIYKETTTNQIKSKVLTSTINLHVWRLVSLSCLLLSKHRTRLEAFHFDKISAQLFFSVFHVIMLTVIHEPDSHAKKFAALEHMLKQNHQTHSLRQSQKLK